MFVFVILFIVIPVSFIGIGIYGMFLALNYSLINIPGYGWEILGDEFSFYFLLIASILSIIGGGLALTFPYSLYKQSKKNSKKLQENEKKYVETNEVYITEKNKLMVPSNCKTISLLKKIVILEQCITKLDYYIWSDESNLYLFPKQPTVSNIEKYPSNIIINSIPKKDIIQFTIEGDFYRETKISGGGGGGSSIGGAITGGILAGGAGAIIGSRKKVKSIETELINHDTRKTILSILDSGVQKDMLLDFKSYNLLKSIIPEKDINVIEAINISKAINKVENNNKSDDILAQARMLRQMLDEGILSEEQYKEKIDKLM